MEIGKTALGVIGAVAVTAGLGGVYLATRAAEPAAVETSGVEVTQTEQTIEPSEAVAADPRPDALAAPPAARVERAPTRRAAAREPAISRTPAQPQPAAPVIDAPPAVADVRPAAPPAAPAPAAIEPEPPRPAEPPAPEFVDLVVPTDAVVGLQNETALTSETARVEDEVLAHVTRDVRVGDRVAIPAGSKVHGEVTMVERGGRLRDRARLGVRFTSVVLADGTRVPLETETIYRDGDAPSGESAAKIGGGAIGGAIIGGILGGARGAAIGGSIGAGAGTAAALAGGRNPATLPSGTPVTIRVITPTTVTVEK
ncbi:MAG: TrbI/VirB10 family protein [Acidobacteria bacterium]|nr:TrbI/VirB10 family protein [Acidobacteriota bacterium]